MRAITLRHHGLTMPTDVKMKVYCDNESAINIVSVGLEFNTGTSIDNGAEDVGVEELD